MRRRSKCFILAMHPIDWTNVKRRLTVRQYEFMAPWARGDEHNRQMARHGPPHAPRHAVVRGGLAGHGMFRIIVASAPGNSIDLAARVFAEQLTRRWEHPIVVDDQDCASRSCWEASAQIAGYQGHSPAAVEATTAGTDRRDVNSHEFTNSLAARRSRSTATSIEKHEQGTAGRPYN